MMNTAVSASSTSDRPLRFHMQHLVQVTPEGMSWSVIGSRTSIRESCASSA
jgi:hypothetical protein